MGSLDPSFPRTNDLVVIKAAAALVTTALETALAFAERELALRAKDEFLAMLGHELRNPLAPIVSALDLMQMRSGDDGPRELSIVRRQVQHLRRLVDDLLDISRVARGTLSLELGPVDLADVVRDALEATTPQLAARRHALSVQAPERGWSSRAIARGCRRSSPTC